MSFLSHAQLNSATGFVQVLRVLSVLPFYCQGNSQRTELLGGVGTRPVSPAPGHNFLFTFALASHWEGAFCSWIRGAEG